MSRATFEGALIDRLMNRYRADLNAELVRAVGDRTLPLYTMVRYHLGWVDERGNACAGESGKRLRPLLCLLACEAVSGDHHAALPAAAGLELVHNFTLVHDDLMDGDRARRHRPTVWSIWGSAQAINAGDLLYSLGVSSMTNLHAAGLDPQRALNAIHHLQETCALVIEGQFLDLQFEDRKSISVDEYLGMIAKKSAALIGCSLEIGALAGGADAPTRAAFAQVGREMGLAFQIRDDFLGVWGDPALTGKPVGGDIRRKKKALPAVCAFHAASPAQRERLEDIYAAAAPSDAQVAEALRIMDELGVGGAVQELADGHYAAAAAAILTLPIDREHKLQLEALGQFFVRRNA